jgi:hypothetical protein
VVRESITLLSVYRQNGQCMPQPVLSIVPAAVEAVAQVRP